MSYLTDSEKTTQEFTWNHESLHTPEASLSKNTAGGIAMPDLNLPSRAYAKYASYSDEDRLVLDKNRKADP